MMIINANTKIAALIKENPGALEAIVSISPKFVKLRNPVLRKLIAGRTSIAMASTIGGCSVNEFFSKLQPLGFEIDKAIAAINKDDQRTADPTFLKNLEANKITELDVRPVIEAGKDPLNIILQRVQSLEKHSVLKIMNTFEPTPLIHLLGKQGFESYVEVVNDQLVNTYFYKREEKAFVPSGKAASASEGWDEILSKFGDNIVTVDVRKLEMPLPMHNILEALDSLPDGDALFVYHKRIPVFLLPELEDRKFSYRIKEIDDQEVHLLIYKD